MQLETLNKLYLELSQIATAETEREIRLRAALIELLPPHLALCVMRDADGSFPVDSDGELMVSDDSCQCAAKLKRIRKLL